MDFEELAAASKVVEFMISTLLTGEECITFIMGLVEFVNKFSDSKGIQAMARFIEWAQKNNVNAGIIKATIMHDVAGRNDECFSPRTSGY